MCTWGEATAPQWWVVLHGYGNQAPGFLERAAALQESNRFLIAPEALSRFYVDGSKDHQRVGASWMTREERDHEIRDYLAYLDDVAAHFAEETAIEERTLSVLGFSQGACLASEYAVRHPTRYGGIVALSGGLSPVGSIYHTDDDGPVPFSLLLQLQPKSGPLQSKFFDLTGLYGSLRDDFSRAMTAAEAASEAAGEAPADPAARTPTNSTTFTSDVREADPSPQTP